MFDLKLISDSSSDLPDEVLKKYDIDIIPYYISFDGQNYLKDKIDFSKDEFYERIKNVFPKTSLPSIQDYMDLFKKYLIQGKDIFCVCISSKLSGSFQSATNAKNILKEEFPNNNIIVLDSFQVTLGQGALLLEIAKMRDAGISIQEIEEKAKKLITHCDITFTVDSLDYLQRGGRIGKAGAFAGSLLNIKPIIILKHGELVPFAKVRGRKKAINEIMDITMNIAKDHIEDYNFFVLHSRSQDDAKFILETIEEKFSIKAVFDALELGAVVGCHIGPTVVGFGCIRKYETL